MSERLRASDLALLAEETPQTPMHNATLEIFDPGDSGFDYDALLAHIDDRIAFVPALPPARAPRPGPSRQPGLGRRRGLRPRLPRTPLRAAAPGLDRPAARADRADHVAPARPRPPAVGDLLRRGARGRPGRAALQVPPDPRRRHLHRRPRPGAARRRPRPAPAGARRLGWPRPSRRPAELAASAARRVGARPAGGRQHAAQQRRGARTHRRAGPPASSAPSPARSPAGAPAPESPFNVEPSAQRRVVLVRTSLKDYRKVRRVHGGTVNDVILATLSGAIRAWFMTRAESVAAGRRLRALVPMSVIDEELEPTSLGSQVVGHLVDLPIGEGSPVVRLHQVSYALRAHSETGRAVAADRIAGVAGFAPTTFHALGSRVAFKEASGSVNLVITNVPGPAVPDVPRRRRDGRDLPGAAAARRASRSRSASRPTTARSTTASAPTATRCPTSRCSASACARRSTSSSTAPATAGCARRAAASGRR